MKRFLAIIAFASAGLAVGWLASWLLLSFAPRCGYDCESRAFGTFFITTVGCFFGFPLVGYLVMRKSQVTALHTLVLIAILSSLTLVLFGAFYIWNLHRHYSAAEAARPVQPELEFLHMVIATRSVQGFTGSDFGPIKPMMTIPQWQRCLIGTATCGKHPWQAQLLCKKGVVYVNENDWHAFSLIQSENLPGTVPLHSMDLCTSQ